MTERPFWAQATLDYVDMERRAAALVEEGAPGDSFQERYWKGPLISGGTMWMGYPVIKSPFDLWTYQEIIFETRPEVIVETGTLTGASALFMAHVLDALGEGRIYTVDINPYPGLPEHERIVYYNGDSVGGQMVEKVHRVTEGKRTMLILDSDHSYEHVSRELEAYHDIVSPGCYLVVEDSNIGQIREDLMPGPLQAIERFVAGTDEFVIDREREKFLITFNPSGYLRRVR